MSFHHLFMKLLIQSLWAFFGNFVKNLHIHDIHDIEKIDVLDLKNDQFDFLKILGIIELIVLGYVFIYSQ